MNPFPKKLLMVWNPPSYDHYCTSWLSSHGSSGITSHVSSVQPIGNTKQCFVTSDSKSAKLMSASELNQKVARFAPPPRNYLVPKDVSQ